MRGVGQNAYNALPQNTSSSSDSPTASKAGSKAATNAVDVSGRSLDELTSAFANATGCDEAELRIVHDQGNLHFIVPSSSSGTPSLWTRFKAALSDLPLLGSVASLRAARLEVNSVPMEGDDVLLFHSISHAVDNAERAQGWGGLNFHQSIADDTRAKLESQPLTRRHVQQVLSSATDGINRRRGEIAAREQTSSAPAARETAMTGRKASPRNYGSPLQPWLVPYAGERNRDLFAECAKVVTGRVGASDKAVIGQEAQRLYGQVQAFLAPRGAWPVKDVTEVADVVATMDVNNATE